MGSIGVKHICLYTLFEQLYRAVASFCLGLPSRMKLWTCFSYI